MSDDVVAWSAAIQAAATVVLVGVTIVYVRRTALDTERMAENAEDALEHQRRQAQLRQQAEAPNVHVTTSHGRGAQLVTWTLKNNGASSAHLAGVVFDGEWLETKDAVIPPGGKSSVSYNLGSPQDERPRYWWAAFTDPAGNRWVQNPGDELPTLVPPGFQPEPPEWADKD